MLAHLRYHQPINAPHPIFGSNTSIPTTDVAPSPSTHILRTHSSLTINDTNVQEEVGDRPMIRLVGGGYEYNKFLYI